MIPTEIAAGLISGFAVAVTPENLAWALLGAALGTMIGVLPGLGAPATIALLLPVTYRLEPVSAVILLAGIFQGAMYGGSTTSILLNIPGETASVVTCLDGHALSRRGRTGPALGIAAISSFVAATISLCLMSLLAPGLAEVALWFGPPEYTALVILGLIMAAGLSTGSMLKGLVMLSLGVLLSTVGIDPVFGEPRFTLGIPQLADGFDFVIASMGLFGIAEVLTNLESRAAATRPGTSLRDVWPSREDWQLARGAILRGTGIGFVIGALPGGGAVVSSLIAYAFERRVSRHPNRFGHGAIEGIAAPEAANNAASTSSFIPLLTLGVPGNSSIAMIFVALLIHGVQPGPLLITERPEMFWGVIASMYVANTMLVLLNLPLVWVWVRFLNIPYYYLAAFVLVVCAVGAYSIRGMSFDIAVMAGFGVLGFLLRRNGFPVAPLLLALILGSMLERSFVQSVQMSGGSLSIFVVKPISAVLLAVAAILLMISPGLRLTGAAGGPTSPPRDTSPGADRPA